MRAERSMVGARGVGLVIAVLAAWVLAGSAGAEDREPWLERDVVQGVNVTRSTIALRGQTFRVAASSVLQDARGLAIELVELRASNGSSQAGDYVEYSVAPGASGDNLPVLQSLRVLDVSYE